MKRILLIGAVLNLFLWRSPFLQAQSNDKSEIELRLEEFANQMSDNLEGYLQPFADSFGGAMNSGLYHTAKIPKDGLHVYVGIESAIALIGENQTLYTARYKDPLGIQPDAVVADAPTIFGKKDNRNATFFGTNYPLPNGVDLRVLPIIAPRITIGSMMGTELSFRWVELDLPEDFGLFKLQGFGLRHNISQYMGPLFPLDLCFGFFVQDMELGRIFKANMGYFGAQASRKLGPLTVYGGIGLEKNSIRIGYNAGEFGLDIQPITLANGNQRTRINVGGTLSLLLLKLHVDYNLGYQNIVVVGAGIGF